MPPATPSGDRISTTAPSVPPDASGDRCTLEPPSTDPAPFHRCPRCGGASLPRKRRPLSVNPFLTLPPPSNALTCVDCGLDFELDASSDLDDLSD